MHMTFTGERYVPQLRGQMYYEHLHRYAVAMSLAAGKDVLDIASGEGYGSALLARVAHSVVGVDIEDAAVRFAGSRYTAMNLSFRTGSAAQIPIADASVDLIVSFETIEHLIEHERMFAEFKRVLRPDGRLIISSPNKLIYSDSRDYVNPYHVRELYFHEFRDVLRDFFSEVRLFGHRIFAGSAVFPLSGASADTTWLGPSAGQENGISALPDAEYFLAICSNVAGTMLPDLCSVFLDPRDDLLTDVRSGGLAATDLPQAFLSSERVETPSLTAGRLSLSDNDASQNGGTSHVQRIFELEALRSAEFDRAEALKGALQQTNADFEELERTLQQERAQRDETIGSLKQSAENDQSEVRKARRLYAELQLSLENARDEIGSLRQSCHDRDVEAHALRTAITAAGAFADELSIRALARDTPSGLNSDTERLETDLTTRDILIDALVIDRDRSDALLAQALEHAARVQLAAEALRSSNSWKITEPIRRAAAALSLGGK